MNAEISETMRVTILGLGTQIPEISAQRKRTLTNLKVRARAKNNFCLSVKVLNVVSPLS